MTVFCSIISFFFGFPQAVYDYLYDLVGVEPPILDFGIGSMFGCNI
jgi:hypothetical protein